MVYFVQQQFILSRPRPLKGALMSASTRCGHHEPALTRLPARPAILKHHGLRARSQKIKFLSGGRGGSRVRRPAASWLALTVLARRSDLDL
jgi:hypothetical protein